MQHAERFDPDGAGTGDGIFGLPCSREQARIVVIPAPFDATTSYRGGTARGPDAVRRASLQVDLFDQTFGPVWRQGIWMEPIDPEIEALSARARRSALPIIERGGAGEGDDEAVRTVNDAGDRVNAFVAARVAEALDQGRVPAVLGGDHSTPFAAIEACAERFGAIGVLQIDAHMDLRDAYEGFRWSHASIMRNVLERVGGVQRLVQVGVRDVGQGEVEYAQSLSERVRVWPDDVLWRQGLAQGLPALCARIVQDLPQRVYVSFDIDGLDPSLCPSTGTPVPGGLTFREMTLLLETLARSGRSVVGFDLVEVGPDEWDANVGARVLYKLCGLVGARLSP